MEETTVNATSEVAGVQEPYAGQQVFAQTMIKHWAGGTLYPRPVQRVQRNEEGKDSYEALYNSTNDPQTNMFAMLRLSASLVEQGFSTRIYCTGVQPQPNELRTLLHFRLYATPPEQAA